MINIESDIEQNCETSKEVFIKKIANNLNDVYTELHELGITQLINKETMVDSGMTEKICKKLKKLQEDAKNINDDAKLIILEKLEIIFWQLETSGIYDKPDIFREKSIEAFEALEMAALCFSDFTDADKKTVSEIILEDRRMRGD